MEQQTRFAVRAVARLVPRETFGDDANLWPTFTVVNNDFNRGDLVKTEFADLSRHLKWLDDDYQSGNLDRLEERARCVVMLADKLGLRRVGQVAADVVYCVDGPDEVALSATLSRLMRLMTQALDHAEGPVSVF